MDEFVVCPSCGTRIKAGREFCLRCFGPLPTPERPAKPPIWESLGLSDTKKQAVAGAVAVIVIGLGAFIYLTEPPSVDETARPVVNVPAPRAGARPAVTAAAAVPAGEAPPAPAETTSAVGIFEATSPATTPPAPEDVAALESKRKTYESELEKSPDDVALLNDLGVVLTQLGRHADAVPRFERALQLSPDQARVHSNFANALMGAGLWDRAVLESREAAKLRPDKYLAQYSIGALLHRKGDDQAAVPELQKAVKMAPNESSARLLLGVSLESVGRREEAVKEYQRYLQLQPNSPDSDRLRAHLQAMAADKP
jgi:tetratricopeptide (TPR) repeat protein